MALSWHAGLIKPPKEFIPVGWVTTRTVAEMLNVKVETVQRWVRQGKLVGRQVGNRKLFEPRDVARAVEEWRIRPGGLGTE